MCWHNACPENLFIFIFLEVDCQFFMISFDRFYTLYKWYYRCYASQVIWCMKGNQVAMEESSSDIPWRNRASDPVLSRDPFSSLMWVLFCLPYPFLSCEESLLSLVHVFYVVSIAQVCQCPLILYISNFNFPLVVPDPDNWNAGYNYILWNKSRQVEWTRN